MSSSGPQFSVSPNVEATRQRRKARLQPDPKAPLREQMREVMRFLRYSPRTEEPYWQWTERLLRFHRRPDRVFAGPAGRRHPRDLGAEEGVDFLGHLASGREVAAATQNQASDSLMFLYGEVLHLPLGQLDGFVRARRPARLHESLSENAEPLEKPMVFLSWSSLLQQGKVVACANPKPGATRRGGHGIGRSAELHSAVSPICNPQTPLESGPAGLSVRPAECNSAEQQIENLRYN